MKRVKLDSLKNSVSSRDCYPLQASRSARRDWLKGSSILLATLNNGDKRHVTCVKFFTGTRNMTAMMDCITGSLYREGRCLSSDVLEILDIDEHDHSLSLLEKPSVDWRAKQW